MVFDIDDFDLLVAQFILAAVLLAEAAYHAVFMLQIDGTEQSPLDGQGHQAAGNGVTAGQDPVTVRPDLGDAGEADGDHHDSQGDAVQAQVTGFIEAAFGQVPANGQGKQQV